MTPNRRSRFSRSCHLDFGFKSRCRILEQLYIRLQIEAGIADALGGRGETTLLRERGNFPLEFLKVAARRERVRVGDEDRSEVGVTVCGCPLPLQAVKRLLEELDVRAHVHA